jgi:hypothetical protein
MPEREFSEEDKEGFRAAFTIFDKGYTHQYFFVSY